MSADTAPAAPADPGFASLPEAVYAHLVHTLRLALPPPPSDAPEARARRDQAAVAGVAALAPVDAVEAELAAQFVAAAEQGKHCLRLAQAPDAAAEWAGKCRAQGLAMMRQADAALRLLVRLQARRGRLERDHVARDRAAWTERCALGLMAQALSACPHPDPLPPVQPRPKPEPKPKPEPERPSEAPRPAFAPHRDPDLLAAAERYAAAYPERAAAIRRSGRLPSDVRYFDPPEAALAPALIHGRTPALAALDEPHAPGEA